MRRLVLFMILGISGFSAPAAEYNPIRQHSIPLGPQANRLIVGFRVTTRNAVLQSFKPRGDVRSIDIVQARTTTADVTGLAVRVGLSLAKSRQITSSMHVMFLSKTLYGKDVEAALSKLRADSAVQFADVDERRYPLSLPNDPMFAATTGATGQWYMRTPSSATGDLSATDAISAWEIATGSTAVIVADVDSGVRFEHPDLLRAGLGGRLLPGYDFVGQDYDPTNGTALGTYLVANDGDGWDPDPSDPGDWISSADQLNTLFPSTSCSVADSSWHGTRVAGIIAAITNNDTGIAGMTWGSWMLPVRALGKCGGYDSDIIAGIEWAAGISLSTAQTAVPDNPFPADIINLSIGGSGGCPTSYQSALSTVTGMGVLVVVSAGNASGSVEAPANCSTSVPGVIAVAGLRNVGTKVGYSSFGPEIGISAPAGNCINSTGACLRSIDTTTNSGLTVPGDNTYTNQTNSNLGTSFSAPVVSGIAALMRTVNGNLTPAQLVARLESGASAFPANTGNLPVCPSSDTTTGECSCPASGECGAGMANARGAVNAALKPIAAVSFPATFAAGTPVVFDAGGSAASCNRNVASYAWTASGGVTILSGAAGTQVTVTGPGVLTLTVKDSQGGVDTANIAIGSTSASTSAPSSAGNHACPAAVAVSPIAPTVSEAFQPVSVGPTIASTLTITLSNANAYDLTQVSLTDRLPTSVNLATSPVATTNCTGAAVTVTTTSTAAKLTGAVIPVKSTCSVTLTVSSATPGSYTNTIAADALSTGPAGGNRVAAAATLTVTTPIAPTIAQGFSPGSVAENSSSTLTVKLSNSNSYALTQAALTLALPGDLRIATSTTPSSTCAGSLATAAASVTLSGGIVPAAGNCTLTLKVSSGTAGTYATVIAAKALTTAQSATNTNASSASLTVTASSSGGGALNGFALVLLTALVTATRWHESRRWIRRSLRRHPD